MRMGEEITLPSGALRISTGDVVAVIERWKAQRESAAATAVAAGVTEPLLPYHTALLDTAKAFLGRDEYQVAVMIAQTAVEVLVEQVITEQLKKRKTAAEVEEWILNRAMPFTLIGGSTQKLYIDLTNDPIQQAPFWERYTRHTRRRNDVVHRGKPVEKPMAEESVAVASEVIRHLEQRRG
jgi:HEPN domain-containing protein